MFAVEPPTASEEPHLMKFVTDVVFSPTPSSPIQCHPFAFCYHGTIALYSVVLFESLSLSSFCYKKKKIFLHF